MAASHQEGRRKAVRLPLPEKGLFTSQPVNEPRRISLKLWTPTAAKVQPVNEDRGCGFARPEMKHPVHQKESMMGANSLVAYARRMLNESVELLSPRVALKLKKARIKALEQARRR